MRDLDALQRQIGEWAVTTFSAATPRSWVAHLREEVDELDDEVFLRGRGQYEEEAADCLILLLGLAHKLGFSLADAVVNKQARNVTRQWSDPDERGVVRHVEVKPS